MAEREVGHKVVWPFTKAIPTEVLREAWTWTWTVSLHYKGWRNLILGPTESLLIMQKGWTTLWLSVQWSFRIRSGIISSKVGMFAGI